jgi:hypothetical protein
MKREREGVEELAGDSIQREVPLATIDGIVIYSGKSDGAWTRLDGNK